MADAAAAGEASSFSCDDGTTSNSPPPSWTGRQARCLLVLCLPPNDTTDKAAAAAAALKEWAREPLWEADEEAGGVLLDRIRARRLEGKAGCESSAVSPAILVFKSVFVAEVAGLRVVLAFSLSARTARRVLPCSTAVEEMVALESGSGAVTERSMAIAASRPRCVGLCICKKRRIYAKRECRNEEVKKTRDKAKY